MKLSVALEKLQKAICYAGDWECFLMAEKAMAKRQTHVARYIQLAPTFSGKIRTSQLRH